jgi:cell division protein FtsB
MQEEVTCKLCDMPLVRTDKGFEHPENIYCDFYKLSVEVNNLTKQVQNLTSDKIALDSEIKKIKDKKLIRWLLKIL